MALSPEYILTELLHGACADSIHDFGISKDKNTKKGTPTLGDVLKTLPGNHAVINKNIRDENTLLNIILKIKEGDKPIEMLVKELVDSKFTKTLEVTGLTNNTYTIKLLHDSTGKYNIRNIRKTIKTDEYKAFFNISGSDPLNMLIDAQTVTINELFGHAVAGPSGKIYVNNILNREVVNDPAPKTYDMKVFKNDGQAVYKIKYDKDPRIITYSSFETSNNELNRNKFFSTLDLCISPLDTTTANSLPKVNLDIIDKNKKIVHQTNDPHKTNNVATCIAYIKKLLGTTGDKHVKCSAFFQCKRSGDWLQALSCFDVGRQYSDGKIQGKITLVTHDRILLWYALFMGINVIFTGSIAGTGAPDYQGTNYDEDDDTELDLENIKRQKIMLYFGANAETPDDRLTRYKALAEAYNAKLATFEENKRQYNTWIQEIIASVNTQIDAAKVNALGHIHADKGKVDIKELSKATKEVLQLFWKLTAIHYVEYDIPVTNTSTALADLEVFVSKCITVEGIQDTIKSKSDLLYKSRAYEVNDEYTNIPDMYLDYTRKVRAGESNEIRTLKFCNYLQFRLPNQYIINLSGILEEITNKYKAVTSDSVYNKNFIINYVIAIFNRDNYDKLSDIIVEYLKHGAKEKVPTGIDLNKEAETSADDADDKADYVDDGIPGNRGRAFVVSDMYVEIYGEEYANKVEGVVVGGSVNEGMQSGGSKHDSYMLYMCYLYTLMTAVGGFDDDDCTDYMYYDALARLVCSSVHLVNNNFDSLLVLPFYALPNGDWDPEDTLIKNREFKECVRIVSHNVALQTVNMREGDIPFTNRHNAPNPMETKQFKINFKDITSKMIKLPFKSRQKYILGKLSNIISHLNSPKEDGPKFHGIAMVSGPGIQAQNTRKLKKTVSAVGGKKKYKGSPRRRTLRKTRKHR
ncbi:MAG: hypothetical protein EBU66_15695 [Bacteroidetes bacterium]|nr:hypothetical protein [Bacteroidota bacterium]